MSTDKIYSPPTDEQLQRFVEVLLASDTRRRGITNIDAAAGARMVMCNPALKESWLKYHRELQMRALGQSR